MNFMVTPAPLGGWDFSPGDAIRNEAWHRFRSPVHFSSKFSSSSFRLVVDLPRSNFHLTTSPVALALRAVTGGSPGDLSVIHLKERSFSFLVCSKQVGIWIYRLNLILAKILLFVSSFGEMVVLTGSGSLILRAVRKIMNGSLFSQNAMVIL